MPMEIVRTIRDNWFRTGLSADPEVSDRGKKLAGLLDFRNSKSQHRADASVGPSRHTTSVSAVKKYSVVKHPAVRDARACDLLLFLRRGLLRLGQIGLFRDGLVEEFLSLHRGEAAHKLGITGS